MKALSTRPVKQWPTAITSYLVGVSIFLGVVAALILEFSGGRLPVDRRFVTATLCLNALLAILLLLAHREVQLWVTARAVAAPASVWFFVLLLLLLYVVYAEGTDSFELSPFVKLLVYVFLPTLILLTVREPEQRLLWQDVVAILSLWLPLDFRWMRDVWGWPSHSLAYSMNSLLATGLAVFLFVCVRRLDGVGFHCHFQKRDGWIGVRNFLFFAPIAVPIGLVTGFIRISNGPPPYWNFALTGLGIFFLIAIPEELLFRGIIQNLLATTSRKPALALIVTSLIFGAAHLNNGPRPDWRYFLLASLAGLFYGNAYQQTRGLLAPAIVHTLVDTVWRGFFR